MRATIDVDVALATEPPARLRTLTRADAAALLAAADADRERLHRWVPWPARVRDLAGAREVLAEYEDAVDRRAGATGAFLGDVLGGGTMLIRHDARTGEVELGVWASAAAEGRGLMRAACAATIAAARAQLGVQRVVWRVEPENARSRALAARLGFVEEGTARAAVPTDAGRVDLVVLSLVEAELDAFGA